MNKKGLTLIEVLVALTLLAIAAPLVVQIFFQGARYTTKIKHLLEERRPAEGVFLILENDLKNSVFLSSSPFQGSRDGLSFVCLGRGLQRVSYRLEQGNLVRLENGLDLKADDAEKQNSGKTDVAGNVKNFTIAYGYRDQKGGDVFLPYWSDAQGLPKALKIEITFEGAARSRSSFIFLPQGRMGTVSA